MEETLIKRIMPNSLEAEQSVVGSMIMSKDAIVTASELLIKDDFYHKQYGIIFDTMVELFTEGMHCRSCHSAEPSEREGCSGGDTEP